MLNKDCLFHVLEKVLGKRVCKHDLYNDAADLVISGGKEESGGRKKALLSACPCKPDIVLQVSQVAGT